ncbi:MAG: cysteine hydrolase [Beijerinckiaceae bacterium]|jgi:nicotinamidase-related amidase|nr:cysteine hydrolase [Beijerinckiaceae bacterium]
MGWIRNAAAAAVILSAGLSFTAKTNAQTIVDEWASLKFPPAPELKLVKVDPKTTALLLFDFTHQTCSKERRPRCAASVPKLKALHDHARAHSMFVVYSIATADSKPSDILPEIAPREGDPVLPSLGPDKFVKSEFEKMLRDKGIQTLIITGTAAQTTVLHTGGSAALRGFKVVVPVDAMSSNEAFTEAYTAWHLANSARIMNVTTLTTTDRISY